MPAGASDGPRYGEMFPRYGSDVPTLRVHASHVTGPVPPGGAVPPSPNGPNETEMRLEGIPMHSIYSLQAVNKHITHSEAGVVRDPSASALAHLLPRGFRGMTRALYKGVVIMRARYEHWVNIIE